MSTVKGATDTVSKSSPWAMIATVGLLVAKYGFGVKIALLWCLAPIWVPITIGLGILAGLLVAALIIGAFALFGVFGAKVLHEIGKDRELRTHTTVRPN